MFRRAVVLVAVFITTAVCAAAQDAIDPATIQVVGGSPDVRGWAVTASMRRVTLLPNDFQVVVDRPASWRDVVPPGWDGPIQFTLWVVVRKDGQWRTTGSIEFWRTRAGVNGPLSDALHNWWYYAAEIGQPQPGETVGVFVAAGDQRRKDVRSVEERSNIVTFIVPPGDSGSFDFAPVAPAPIPTPAPIPAPVPIPSVDLSTVLAHLDVIAERLAQEQAQNQQAHQAIREDVKAFRDDVNSKWSAFFEPIVKYVLPAVGGLIAGWQVAK